MLYHLTMRRLMANARTVLYVTLLGCFALQQTAQAQAADEGTTLETVIVTASRTPDTALTLPVAWSALNNSTIDRIAPQHSNQVFNRVAGAWVSRGNGQESLISLRSPVLTGAGSCGAFMTAQDGISLRSPGFCNVNQLFDANLLQAGKLEVLKGPATVVFGSNAQHGIINVLSRSVSDTPDQIKVEAGSRDYYRLAGSAAFGNLALSAQTAAYGAIRMPRDTTSKKRRCASITTGRAGGLRAYSRAATSIRKPLAISGALRPTRMTMPGKKTPILRPIAMPGRLVDIWDSRATGAPMQKSPSGPIGAVTV